MLIKLLKEQEMFHDAFSEVGKGKKDGAPEIALWGLLIFIVRARSRVS